MGSLISRVNLVEISVKNFFLVGFMMCAFMDLQGHTRGTDPWEVLNTVCATGVSSKSSPRLYSL